MAKPVKYRTAGGQIVNWTPKFAGDDYGTWTCEGCGDTDTGFRDQADKHALNCRAL
ncbi:hypothetical protein [Streptosporangium sp. NPDC002721]|uniref:hypothetical protein n=1 Tax=Streptosporangium sp. NPDC002721 TaxID=3366188 RepID=UPI0036965229